jgi:hypothetical protein
MDDIAVMDLLLAWEARQLDPETMEQLNEAHLACDEQGCRTPICVGMGWHGGLKRSYHGDSNRR